ncbi:hypothetical protein FXO38_35315 [Capsicum annuum]|nr:hypothetical protein FXO38_35315 [Capsicum annuum]KAF3638589.1 hypothetical protein FXO37_24299 [Capsicum annuum]
MSSVHLAPSVGPPVVPTFTFCTPQTLSVIPPSALAFEYGILILKVSPLSMLPPQVVSHFSIFPMSLLILGTVISLEDQKRFERFTNLGPSRFSGVLVEYLYDFLIDYREKLHNLGFS